MQKNSDDESKIKKICPKCKNEELICRICNNLKLSHNNAEKKIIIESYVNEKKLDKKNW